VKNSISQIKKALIEKKIIEQFFDEEKQMFLPDRYIVGT